MKKELRDYQQEAINTVLTELENGCDKQLLVMSMGLGKTFTAVKLEEAVKSKKTCWLTDDERLLSQSAVAFVRDKFGDELGNEIEEIGFVDYFRSKKHVGDDKCKLSLIKAEDFDISGDIVFCSVQTMWRRLDRLPQDLFDVMIIDEAHGFGSKTGFMVLEHFQTRLRLGLTATPYRIDGMLMGDMFDKIVYEYGMDKGIKNGYLCELDAIKIKTNINIDKVKTQGGDFKTDELCNEINTLARNHLIADSYLEYCKGRQAIGYGVNIKHCIDMAEVFQEKGINAVAISSNKELTGDSKEPIKLFKQGKIDVLFNVNLLSKGFDHPDTGCMIAAAPTKSLVRYLQGPAGRGSRLKSKRFVEKFGQNCIILDITDVTTRHNLINGFELDKKKPLEDRCFISQEKKDKILAEKEARKAKLEHERDKDEHVKLLELPERKLFKSIKMKEPATEPQLKWISDLGYDIVNEHYTKQMCADIISLQPCNKTELEYLASKGYDTKFANKGHYSTVYYEHEIKRKAMKKWKKKS